MDELISKAQNEVWEWKQMLHDEIAEMPLERGFRYLVDKGEQVRKELSRDESCPCNVFPHGAGKKPRASARGSMSRPPSGFNPKHLSQAGLKPMRVGDLYHDLKIVAIFTPPYLIH